ncbi:TPM domain-containing protein [Deefgea piscis]|uniref:TPM domain-containing protein n=1 Tax=Deefgea piscis TaxID=2739061 RepID=A0A6M8SRB3_9NEIS|nr:TPM domain-containing protein [Deefgea piscis]QKJ66664.1 TPM domain-containing protein [Deefgea piscis]
MQKFKRLWLHLKPNQAVQYFNAANQAALSQVITSAEQGHRGEIRLIIEARLPMALIWQNTTARERALSWFSDLRVWDTEGNTGIVLYLLLAERQLELVADRGIANKVPPAQWQAICQQLERDLAANQVLPGLSQTLKQLGDLLAQHFPLPIDSENPNELSNEPVIVI